MKSYIAKKKHSWGIKIWKATDATSGYMWSFEIYQGADAQKPAPAAHEIAYGVGERVVVDFVKQMPRGQPWIVYIDNYFTSVRLLHDLKVDYGVYATGTVNVWSKMFPAVLASMQPSLQKAKRGTSRYVMFKPGILLQPPVQRRSVFPLRAPSLVRLRANSSNAGYAGRPRWRSHSLTWPRTTRQTWGAWTARRGLQNRRQDCQVVVGGVLASDGLTDPQCMGLDVPGRRRECRVQAVPAVQDQPEPATHRGLQLPSPRAIEGGAACTVCSALAGEAC